MKIVTGGIFAPPYVATFPVFETPAARYPAWKAAWLVENSIPFKFGYVLPG
ncbi:unannotated protein [freshwater metagenome]|uniref:Unannotated protein n=1 Tax=freshwater metagenome TaxID=449393 RepID=A0A6J7BFI9_9ZZZZ